MANSEGLLAFSQSVAQWPLSIWIDEAGWVIPIVQSIHILAIASVMSSIAMLNLRLAGFIGRSQSVRAMAAWFLPWMWWSLPILLVTGLVMIIGEPERELMSRLFWSKMGLLLLVIVITIPLQRILEDRPFREMSQGKRFAVRTTALASLIIWMAIISCGRWIAYG